MCPFLKITFTFALTKKKNEFSNAPTNSKNHISLLHNLYALISLIKTKGSGNSIEFLKNRGYPKNPYMLICGMRHNNDNNNSNQTNDKKQNSNT